MRAVVIGGGIAGLCAGLAAKQVGMEVVVCERHPEIRAAGASLALWPLALHTLDRLGALDQLLPYGVSEPAEYRDQAGVLIAPEIFGRVVRDYAYSKVTFKRQYLSEALASVLGETALRTSAEFVRYAETEDGVVAYFTDGSTEMADVLIGADGIYSEVRAHAFPGAPRVRRHDGHVAWRALLDARAVEGVNLGEQGLRLGRDKTRGGWLRASEDTLFWAVAQLDATTSPEQSRREEVLSRIDNLDDGTTHFALRDLVQRTPDKAILREEVCYVPRLSRWVSGRVALVGDAAHAVSPHIAAGATLAIEDSFVLGAALETEQGIPEALAAYESDRLNRWRMVLPRIEGITELAGEPKAYGTAWANFLLWMHQTSAAKPPVKAASGGWTD